MSAAHTTADSDALVFFGATGDLAYKQIFPALQALVRRGQLNMPVIGVAGRSWTSDQLRERARQSVQEHGDLDTAAFDRLAAQLTYVGGDYSDPGPSRISSRRLARSSARCITWRSRPHCSRR